MAGLGGAQMPEGMAQNPQAASDPQSPGAMPPQAGGEGGMPADVSMASPEEQATYNRFVAMAIMGLSDEKLLPKTVEMLRSNDDPVAAVAEVASAMAMRVYMIAKGEGTSIDGDILMHGGKEIVEATIEIAEAAGVQEFSPEMMEQAFYRSADLFTAQMKQSGDLDEEAMGQDVPQLVQMRDNGQLEQMLSQMQQMMGGAPDGEGVA